MSDPTPQQTAITRKQDTPGAALNRFLNDPRRVRNLADYARGIVKPETLIRLALYEANRPEASWMTKATPESIYASLIVAAQLGLEPSSVRGECYLVPFAGQCTLMPGYRGLMKLALRSGEVRRISARVVYQGDEFLVKYGTDESIVHDPALGRIVPKGDQAPEIVAAYAIAVMANGEKQFDVMDGWELDKHRAASMQSNGPAWKTWPEEMYRKAPVRRLAKYLPLGEDFAKALAIDDLHATGKADKIAEYIDVPVEEKAEESEPQSAIAKAAAGKSV
jgi:recombination protein RecT